MRNDKTTPADNPGLRAFMQIARRNRPVAPKAIRALSERPRTGRTSAQLRAYLRIERGHRA